MDTVSLPQLPATVLVTIAKLMAPADLVSLCDSHPQLAFLRLYLPELQDIPGESFRKYGPSDGHFCPELYFTSPVIHQRVGSITLTFRWKDQGFGNRKGMLWIELVRQGQLIATSKDDFPTLAPHQEETQEIVIRNHPVVDLIRKGDTINFMRNVGGGGGHSLSVQEFNAKLELYKY